MACDEVKAQGPLSACDLSWAMWFGLGRGLVDDRATVFVHDSPSA